MPQYKFLCQPGSRTPSVDFIGYFEFLNEDFTYVQKRLGCHSSPQHLNKTEGGKKDYREYYTETTRKIVTDVYQEDIHIFGYNFDNTFLKR